jgi:hypothetical protein
MVLPLQKARITTLKLSSDLDASAATTRPRSIRTPGASRGAARSRSSPTARWRGSSRSRMPTRRPSPRFSRRCACSSPGTRRPTEFRGKGRPASTAGGTRAASSSSGATGARRPTRRPTGPAVMPSISRPPSRRARWSSTRAATLRATRRRGDELLASIDRARDRVARAPPSSGDPPCGVPYWQLFGTQLPKTNSQQSAEALQAASSEIMSHD